MMLLLAWFTETETEYKIKMLKKKSNFSKFQQYSNVI